LISVCPVERFVPVLHFRVITTAGSRESAKGAFLICTPVNRRDHVSSGDGN
jgi:hypothetical protein